MSIKRYILMLTILLVVPAAFCSSGTNLVTGSWVQTNCLLFEIIGVSGVHTARFDNGWLTIDGIAVELITNIPTYAVSSSYATNAGYAVSSGYATNAGTAVNCINCAGQSVDGGFASSVYLISQHLDGGFAGSVYLISQHLEGGNATSSY